jgi:selenocysteine-specific elongation factor
MLAARTAALDKPAAWCELMLKEAAGPLEIAELARRCHMPLPETQAICDKLTADGAAINAGGTTLMHRTILDAAIATMLGHLEDFHKQNKLRLGIDEPDLVTALSGQRAGSVSDGANHAPSANVHSATAISKAVFSLALWELIRKGKVVRRGTVLSLAGKGPNVSAADMELCSQIEAALGAAKITPPSPYELSQQLSCPLPRLEAMIRLLCDQGKLVRLDQNLVMHADAVESAKKVALALFVAKGGFETVDFRDALGVSRKFAVPLLDYFDTIRLTVRSGSRRTPGAAAKNQAPGFGLQEHPRPKPEA